MTVDAKRVKALRDRTGIGIMDCKAALTESHGDIAKAEEILRKRGLATAAKKHGRETSEGRIGSYLHSNGKVGVMVEVQCETDFAAKTDDFQRFLKELCLHICAFAPIAVGRDEIDRDLVEKEREIYREQVKGKPENVMDKIIDGKLEKFFQEKCLLDQKWVKDDKRSVRDVLTDIIAKTGENIAIKRFARLEVGG